MIRFLFKGLLRDRSRSLFPIMIVAIGVSLTVLMHSWVGGVMNDIISSNARFMTGHVKVMTRSYADNEDQIPNDLAIIGVEELVESLKDVAPDVTWMSRIKFGGLLDIPDENGETRAQGPAMGMGVDLLSSDSPEVANLNIEQAIVRGRLPRTSDEILISETFAEKLEVNPGEQATLISSTMNGSMSLQNFIIAGTVKFGITAMDRGAVIIDIEGVRQALDMDDAAGEILGLLPDMYEDVRVTKILSRFHTHFADQQGEFDPVMITLKDQNGLGEYLQYAGSMTGIMVFGFIVVMSIVLWNAGLLGGLRRYGEIGVRLAIGEEKGKVYRAMIMESVLIGVMGSIIGTIFGLGIAYLIQVKGVNFGALMKNSSMMMSNVVRTQITSGTYTIGFVPGIFSTVLGSVLSGIGIFKRDTARLFKELEV